MELEKFEQAKKVKEELDSLERQKSKLESALNGCGVEATITFTHPGHFRRKDEVRFFSKDIIVTAISKELERLKEEIDLVKEEFERI